MMIQHNRKQNINYVENLSYIYKCVFPYEINLYSYNYDRLLLIPFSCYYYYIAVICKDVKMCIAYVL